MYVYVCIYIYVYEQPHPVFYYESTSLGVLVSLHGCSVPLGIRYGPWIERYRPQFHLQ